MKKVEIKETGEEGIEGSRLMDLSTMEERKNQIKWGQEKRQESLNMEI